MDAERRRRFIEYFNGPLGGDRQKLMKKTGISKGRVTQLLDPNETFGQLTATRLAKALKLDPHYFERDAVDVSVEKLSPEALAFAAKYEAMTTKERHRLARLYEAALDPEPDHADQSEPADELLGGDSQLGGMEDEVPAKPQRRGAR